MPQQFVVLQPSPCPLFLSGMIPAVVFSLIYQMFPYHHHSLRMGTDFLSEVLIRPWMFPVKPYKISISAVRYSAAMTAICRTLHSIVVDYRQGIHLNVPRSRTKISPDLVKLFSSHEESIGVLQKRNRSHLAGVLT
jgi:hypothetical protein